jgi:heat-inducible transcriptional repressor
MRDRGELPSRERDILVAVVRQFIETGAAVGSKTVAEKLPEALSSATIRNVMATLESLGYLSQPHISTVSSSRLAPATEEYIQESLRVESGALEQMMSSASRVLSEVSHNVGLALAPALEEKVLEHIKFVLLPDRRILVVIVSKPHLVESKAIRLEEDFLPSLGAGRWAPSALKSSSAWKKKKSLPTACSRMWPYFSCGAP